MKPSYEELEQQLAESHRALRAETTAHENTQMQLEKMAAENAGLKSVVSEINNELYGHGFQVSGWHLNGALEPLDSWFEENNWNPETPATDAFLAEVRAQGVDELAELYLTLARHEANRSISESWRESARFAKDHSAQLRKGVQS
ncbi:hypothetical protein [Enterobacter kobei]|uniref:hypothetical protein n=1 Tax=Enterobacter kobei TaxID=208224 RepID=UPI001E2D805D|nr:hypothetical protein [Enterobacter kobei]MCD0238038.1 hypothetical protein [Enterobacter kobei]